MVRSMRGIVLFGLVCLVWLLSPVGAAVEGFVVAGWSESFTHGDEDFYIVKMDGDGDMQWQKYLGGSLPDYGCFIKRTSDGGYVLVGAGESYTHGSGDLDCLVYKIDADGKKMWRRNLGGSSDDIAYSVFPVAGGYIVGGMTQSYNHSGGDYDFLVYKLNNAGVKVWRKNYGGSGNDCGVAAYPTRDGGAVLLGYTYSYSHGGSDFLVYKIDGAGKKLWRKNYGGGDDERLDTDSPTGATIQQTSDGGFVFGGTTYSYTHGGGDFLVYKVDDTGAKQWRRNLGGVGDETLYSIEQTADGGYLTAGLTDSYSSGGSDMLLYKLNTAGVKQWRKNYGGGYDDGALHAIQTSDGGYVAAGFSASYVHGTPGVDDDVLVYRLNAAGKKAWRKNFGGGLEELAGSIQETGPYSSTLTEAIIADHTRTDLSQIPSSWITAAKSSLRCSYGHTSHGSQPVTGMTVMEGWAAYGNLYAFNTNGAIEAGVLSLANYTPSGDLGNPDRVTWAARTRDYLNGSGSDRNVVIWSWCGQAGTATVADINTYLNLMSGLETDYPHITFVYMTGHLDGGGADGNLNLRNQQIRDYCVANNKVLFDFADIESYDPDGATNYMLLNANDQCNYSGGNWADQWIAAHPGHVLTQQAALICTDCCAHSRALNCMLKARAFWWMLARIAGWDGASS